MAAAATYESREPVRPSLLLSLNTANDHKSEDNENEEIINLQLDVVHAAENTTVTE